MLFWLLQIHNDFEELLAELKLDSKSQWRKVRSKIEKDPRYKAVESASQKEEWFKEHVEQLYKVIYKLQESLIMSYIYMYLSQN